ncbi:sugar phosphate isomerase/epimerase family protein [Enterococcus casseliflavus]|uniref:sugar phosphate isomerase/epimerase family protein n=1 Tax=Enterococcus casseliflavus TaxID=37734 RepID=UPI0039A5FBEB
MENFTITGFADEISPNLEAQIETLKQNQLSHIEIRGIAGKNVSEFTLAEAKGYQEQLQEAQISVSCIGSPIGKIEITDPIDPHLESFKNVLEVARIFEAPYIRMFSFFIPEGAEQSSYRAEVIDRWQKFLEIASDYPEITLLHENEKGIYGDTPERCLDLIQSLDNPQVRMAFDPANFVQCDVPVYPTAYEKLQPHIAYMHIKDANFSDHKVMPAGFGDGQVKKVLEGLIQNGYQGFLSLEPHLSSFEGFSNLEKENISIEKEQSDGARLFTLASQVLKNIVVNELNQEWK